MSSLKCQVELEWYRDKVSGHGIGRHWCKAWLYHLLVCDLGQFIFHFRIYCGVTSISYTSPDCY